jgi:hypothetical protein
LNLPAAERTIANAITHELRRPWHVHSFDYRGNLAPMTSPFRLTAHSIQAPHTFVERYAWGITDPDETLRLPAFAWTLTEHPMLVALASFPMPQRAEWRTFLASSAYPAPDVPFRKHANRHGTVRMRRSETITPTLAEVAVAFARAATVNYVAAHAYRDAFPVDLWETSQGVPSIGAKISTVHACPEAST